MLDNNMELTLEQRQLIGNTKYLIRELQNIQDLYFDTLVDELKISEDGNGWLFDFIFNEDKPITLEEYLSRYDTKLETLFDE
jgi:hypothetical protein